MSASDPETSPETSPEVSRDDTATETPTVERPAVIVGPGLHLDFAAVSDVGRVRRDNQDSGYAGPWLLTVCDGVGGAARGDIASGTAVGELKALDVPPPPDGTPPILDRVTDALHAAHAQIGKAVDADPSINGTSTTATLALFDGTRVGIGHVGDSRAYLFREGEISQLTTDHTFVQSLIDEGRITEAEARVHPHRNLILKALDGMHEAEPDLFVLEVVAGDRLFLCSDGACGVLDDPRLADILSSGSPDYAATEAVRASLDAGSTDNVTCVVADVVAAPAGSSGTDGTDATLQAAPTPEPIVVGAAADLKRRTQRSSPGRTLFRGHRSGDTGELEPVDAELPDEVPFGIHSDPIVRTPSTRAPSGRPVDPEAARYAPLAPRRYPFLRWLLVVVVVLGLVWIGAAAFYSWSQKQYYVGEQDGVVVIYRGVDASVPVVHLSTVVTVTDLRTDELPSYEQGQVDDGIPADDLSDARSKVQSLSGKRQEGSGS